MNATQFAVSGSEGLPNVSMPDREKEGWREGGSEGEKEAACEPYL